MSTISRTEYRIRLYPVCLLIGISCIFFSCKPAKIKNESPVFQKLSSGKTHITFQNTLTETDTLNYFLYPYIYMGGGVSVGDFNNDGLTDIYLVGNMVSNRMYLNRGNLTFEDVTEISNTGGGYRWKQGSTVCDINNDGLPDIYVCVSGLSTDRHNLLFVNQGINKDGIPVFSEEAEKYGINDPGMSTQATFFDYDNDGDLDLYVANYPITNFKATPYVYKQMMKNVKWIDSGHLFRNNGAGTPFTDVTKESGLLAFGLTLSATVSDFNNDGFKDLYISNDFTCPDYFYLNNGNGTFSDKAGEVLGQTSFYGMGADIADYNNDGLPDIIQIDMAPEDNKRAKENMSTMNPEDFEEMVNEGLHHQYRYSTLQLNRGIRENNLPFFSNAAWIAGVTSTDWSWAALFADFNLDGWKDLFITSGIRRDINNMDYFNKIAKSSSFNIGLSKTERLNLVKNMPFKKLNNSIFRNNSNLTFSKQNIEWGIIETGYSNGVAYADLDNDGDLELVVNNIDGEAFIYKNNAREESLGNYLKVAFESTSSNKMGIGSVVTIWTEGKMQTAELSLSRGYLSSVEPVLYFGLDKYEFIDSLYVKWSDGKIQNLINIKANQKLTLKHANAISLVQHNGKILKTFKEVTDSAGLEFIHKGNIYNDYKDQVLLPHKMSNPGPYILVGDVNNDQLEDLYIGNASKSPGRVYIQNKNGTFKINEGPLEKDSQYEDTGALFFDADNDGDLDLYVGSGGYDLTKESESITDRLYLNDGKGNFFKSPNSLPVMTSNGSCIKAFDFDKDGDRDLFVGGRQLPGKYPFPARSYILENKSSKGDVKFEDVSKSVAPDLLNAGMVTSAFCGDIDNDHWTDLVIIGEWMPVCIYKNIQGKFKKTAIDGTKGWWFSIEGADFDKDGDIDLVAGNLGLNFRYKASSDNTFDVYAGDFNNNENSDIVLSYFQEGKQFSLGSRKSIVDQNPWVAKKFPTYRSFAEATVSDIYTKKVLIKSLHLQAETFASCYFENDGKGNFMMHKLPNEAQLSSINGMIIDDFNNDGNLDVLAAGNLFDVEIVTPRNDGGIGIFLKGDGKGHFTPVPYALSGFIAPGDVKSLALVHLSNKDKDILVGNSNSRLQVFMLKRSP